MERFYEKLQAYGKDGLYPLHMPGHKRNETLFSVGNPYSYDITEIDGFDDLHHAGGILLDAMERAAHLYGSRHTYFLINGSTCGLLSAISALVDRGDKLIMARNCHLSVYHAVFLREANPIYIYPETIAGYGMAGAVSPKELEERIRKDPDVKCVVITSPTYEGVVSDVEDIAKIAHKWGIPLIVDEAHGAHLGFHESFPLSAVAHHADIVIHSVHKTLPAFTQSALLHINGDLVSKDKVERYLSIYQSSSPSYLLLYGIDRCLWFLEEDGKRCFCNYVEVLQEVYHKLVRLKNLRLFQNIKGVKRDWSKIVVSTRGTSINGKELFRILREEHHFQLEMASLDYVIAITSICDRKEELERFVDALLKIDQFIDKIEFGLNHQSKKECVWRMPLPIRMNPYEAYRSEGVIRSIKDCEGEIAKEMIYAYPPGIPLMVPGEEVTKERIGLLRQYKKEGFEVRGLKDGDQGNMEIVSGSGGHNYHK